MRVPGCAATPWSPTLYGALCGARLREEGNASKVPRKEDVRIPTISTRKTHTPDNGYLLKER